jgi:hypothetical protein
MIRLMLLAGAWVLMRRYIFRRRIRIERETVVSKLTAKLRALARMTLGRPAVPRHTRIPGLPVEMGPPALPRPVPGLPPGLSSSGFRSRCRQRSTGFVSGR